MDRYLKPDGVQSTPVGLKNGTTETLYGNYSQYCAEEGVNVCAPSRFKEDLINYLKTIPKFSKCRMCERNIGLVVTNVVLSTKPFFSDSIDDLNPLSIQPCSEPPTSTECVMAADVKTRTEGVIGSQDQTMTERDTGSDVQSREQLPIITVYPDDHKIYDALNREEYISYISLSNHPEFEQLLTLSKFTVPPQAIEQMFSQKLSQVDGRTVSEGFKNRVSKRLQLDSSKITKHGLLVSTYSVMGGSPRVQPIDPRSGSSVLSLGNSVRTYAFLHFKLLLDKHYGGPGQLLDLDLVSCYMNLIVSLYPVEASYLNSLIAQGLWESLRVYFDSKGCSSLYNKS